MGTTFESYRDAFPNARLSRDEAGGLEIALHTDGGKLIFNRHTPDKVGVLFPQEGGGARTRSSSWLAPVMPSWTRSTVRASTSLHQWATTRSGVRERK